MTEEGKKRKKRRTTAATLQALIDVGEAEGILEEEEGELIHSIIEFGDTRVSEVMTPRPDIVAVPETATIREARDVILDSKYSRLPVYGDQIDDVKASSTSATCCSAGSKTAKMQNIRPLIRSVYFVPGN